MRRLSLLILLLNACAAIADASVNVNDYAVVTVLYSAQSGRAFAGLLDRFDVVRFADCKAPTGHFKNAIRPAELQDCQFVEGSAFTFDGANLARIKASLPYDLAQDLQQSLGDVIDQLAAKSSLGRLVMTDVFITALLIYFWRKPLIAFASRSPLKGAGVSSLGIGFTLTALIYNLFILHQEKDVAYAQVFPAFEGELFDDEEQPVAHLSDGKYPIKANDMQFVFDRLRQAILTSVIKLPDA